MEHRKQEPLYMIGAVSRLLKVCPATLRIWERKGLVRPKRIGKNRFYSQCDLENLEHVKELLQKKKINIEGAKQLLKSKPCWLVKDCQMRVRKNCRVYISHKN